MGMRIGNHENLDKVCLEDFTLFANDVHLRIRQVKHIGEEMIQALPSAFEAAVLEAERKGFTTAGTMANRIMNGCNIRSRILLP
jgi:hypothetical protein